ncbi:unnamed protein product [Pneumocystis jirovecii]|uniref:Sepiapterin reductase n=1 Tax=Pneumocystis jirovecii TaxID=42068 RepID=L0P8G6_PNEJI|nr:unnamed protein product [Pneumocystis jirovecii]CCJ28683.1 unnamed protein product [Pneumocystis jirovecii]
MTVNKSIHVFNFWIRLVTGASRGIGKAIVEELLECYSDTFIIAVVRLKKSIFDLEEKFKSRIVIVEGDLKDPETCILAVDTAIERFGRLDSLVLNAGIIEPVGNIVDTDLDAWKALFDVNYFSLLYMIRELKRAIPYLRLSCGRVLFISSGASIKPYQSMGAYSGSKSAMNSLSAVLAAEEKLITSISIQPGVVDTQMQTSLREVYSSKLDQRGLLMPPRKVGKTIASLCLHAKKELSGRLVRYDDDELAEYRNID